MNNCSFTPKDTEINVNKITLQEPICIIYKNDLASIHFSIPEKTEVPISMLKNFIKSKDLTYYNYIQISKEYFTIITKFLLDKIPYNWDSFKNYLECTIPFQGISYDILVKSHSDYKPNTEYKSAKSKFISLNDKEPNLNWS